MIPDTRYRLIQWTKAGAWQGAKWGFRLAGLYMIATTLCFAGFAVWAATQSALADGNTDALAGIFLGLLTLPVIWCFGLILGVVPATIVGGLAGAITGFITAFPSVYESLASRRITGVGVVLFVVEGIVPLFLRDRGISPMALAHDGTFWYFVGVPFLFCLGMVFWLSGKLPTLAPTPMSYETIAAERPVPPPLWLE